MNKKEKKQNKEMSDTKRVVLFTIVIVLVVSIIGVLSYFILREKQEANNPESLKKNATEIAGYSITLDDLDTDLYREEFKKLKKNLESKEINYDEYSESVAKMFVIDLYTIKNKINKYDIGGVEFVLPEGRDNYVTNVTDTIYKYVEDNSNSKRSQQLPVVSSVEVTEVKPSEFKIDSLDKKYESRIYNINISYSADYGYDKTAEVTVINKDNFMYVVEKN
ncbi:MAG: hypothetical protein J1F35_08660 [Erysipelotrichales bacterium]|nr:hypothetical protein [Erysipelotrichales bacterium]